MRIVCPSCQAIYDVPDALLAADQARRPIKLRCARCATEWAPELPQAELPRAEPPRAEPPTGTPPAPEPTPAPGPTPSAFADAIAQAATPRPPDPPAPAPPPPARPQAAPRPLVVERTPPPPAGETLVAEHLASGRPRPDPPARSPRDSATLLFAWCLSLGVLAALLIAAYLHRAEVIAFWPPAARAYDLLGLK
jgi:predicted Zn finger-like uncharacterized protein